MTISQAVIIVLVAAIFILILVSIFSIRRWSEWKYATFGALAVMESARNKILALQKENLELRQEQDLVRKRLFVANERASNLQAELFEAKRAIRR